MMIQIRENESGGGGGGGGGETDRQRERRDEVRGKTDIPTCCQRLHHHINLNLKGELQRLKWGGKSKEREE